MSQEISLNQQIFEIVNEMLVSHRAEIFGVLKEALASNREAEKAERAEGAQVWLRDQFAMAALTGMCAAENGPAKYDDLAKCVWLAVDAVLAARTPEGKP